MPTYYTPNVNEFKISLEFEYLNTITKEWHPILVNEGDRVETYWVIFSSCEVRIKHLDHDDIVDVFGSDTKRTEYGVMYRRGRYILWHTKTGITTIFSDYEHSEGKIFQGTILNKSELLFQMDRLGIKSRV